MGGKGGGLKDEKKVREKHGGDGEGGREREEGKQTVVVCKDSGQSEVN